MAALKSTTKRKKAGAFAGDRKIWRTDASPQTTTDAYADANLAGAAAADAVWQCLGFPRKHIRVKNTGGTNGLTYQILGTVDGVTFDKVILAPANLAFGAVAYTPVTDSYSGIKVQGKAQVGGSQTTFSAQAVGDRA